MALTFKTWASGDILTAADLNGFVAKSPSLYKLVAGQTAYTISAGGNSTTVTCSYNFTFATLIAFIIGGIESNSSIDLVGTLNGSPGLSSASVRIAEKDGTAIAGGVSGRNVHWIAIGT